MGKNYLEHIKELPGVLNMAPEVPQVGRRLQQRREAVQVGASAVQRRSLLLFLLLLLLLLQEPVIFLKSGACLHHGSGSLPLPTHWSADVHHEVELAVELGAQLQPARVAMAIDLTARDVQVGASARACCAGRAARK